MQRIFKRPSIRLSGHLRCITKITRRPYEHHHRSLDSLGRHSLALGEEGLKERWMMCDPALVLERKQERGWQQPETKEERAQKAREQLEALFEERGADEAEHRNLAE